jgi:hypothetical protein
VIEHCMLFFIMNVSQAMDTRFKTSYALIKRVISIEVAFTINKYSDLICKFKYVAFAYILKWRLKYTSILNNHPFPRNALLFISFILISSCHKYTRVFKYECNWVNFQEFQHNYLNPSKYSTPCDIQSFTLLIKLLNEFS